MRWDHLKVRLNPGPAARKRMLIAAIVLAVALSGLRRLYLVVDEPAAGDLRPGHGENAGAGPFSPLSV